MRQVRKPPPASRQREPAGHSASDAQICCSPPAHLAGSHVVVMAPELLRPPQQTSPDLQLAATAYGMDSVGQPEVRTGFESRQTVLGHVQKERGHVHLSEIDRLLHGIECVGFGANPLGRGHLEPYRDQTRPTADALCEAAAAPLGARSAARAGWCRW